MTNQEFRVLGSKYEVLPNFGMLLLGARGLKVTSFPHVFAVSALSADLIWGSRTWRLSFSAGEPESFFLFIAFCLLDAT